MGTQAVISETHPPAPVLRTVDHFEIVKAVLINGEVYHTVPEAARLVGVVPMTMFRWITGKSPSPAQIDALQDQSSKHYYVAAASVGRLKEHRFQKI